MMVSINMMQIFLCQSKYSKATSQNPKIRMKILRIPKDLVTIKESNDNVCAIELQSF